MLQRYCFNGCLASISYVVMSVFVLFCVGVDLRWLGKRVKEKLSDQCGVWFESCILKKKWFIGTEKYFTFDSLQSLIPVVEKRMYSQNFDNIIL